MCSATAVVYSEGVKGVSATGVVAPKELAGKWVGAVCKEGHASDVIDGKVVGTVSEE